MFPAEDITLAAVKLQLAAVAGPLPDSDLAN